MSSECALPTDLPSLPEGWEWRPLGSYASSDRGICYGIVQPGNEVSDGIPIVRVKDFANGSVSIESAKRVAPSIEAEYSRSRLQGGEVLLTLVGTLGLVAVAPEALVGSNVARAVGVIPVESGTARFVSLCLRSEIAQRYIRQWATTTVQATFNLRDLKRLPIPHAPPTEQRGIVSILGALDDKIELNRKMNRTLEGIAQAIFKSWFIDFDGVHPEDLVDSEVGPIPGGWHAKPIDDIIEVIGGGTPKKSTAEYWGGSVPWFSVRDAPSPHDVFVTKTELRITDAGLRCSSARLVPAGTTIISARGTVGKLAVAAQPMTFNQSCYGVRPSRGHGDLFTHFALRTVVGLLQQSAHGSVFDTITRQTFKTAFICIPPVEAAERFQETVKPMMERVLSNCHESRTLAHLRDLLLPKLISGQLRVPESTSNTGEGQ